MIADPTTLLALALCVGILGLAVLILPLLILFWSQMEPQLVGFVGGDAEADSTDEYDSQTVLPRLMKSFGDMAEIEKERTGKKSASGSKSKGSGRRSAATPRAKASVTKKKAAPAAAKTKKKVATAKADSKSATKGKSKVAGDSKTKKKGGAKVKAKSKPKAAARRAPAGAKRDPILGIVYSKKPKEVDDLKEIKGVAKVIEGKLHKAGIYTYQQIVEWDAGAIEAFSDKLSFKGRIKNEGWQKQCAKLHAAKYGEKVG